MPSKKKHPEKVDTKGYEPFIIIQESDVDDVFARETNLVDATIVAESRASEVIENDGDDGDYSVAVYKLVAVISATRETNVSTLRIP